MCAAVLATYRNWCAEARPGSSHDAALLALQALLGEVRLTCSSSYYDAQRWRAALRVLEGDRAMRRIALLPSLVAYGA